MLPGGQTLLKKSAPVKEPASGSETAKAKAKETAKETAWV